MTNATERTFTVAQANATLPLVERIVRDILRLHDQWRNAVVAFEGEQLGGSAAAETEASRASRLAAARFASEVAACLAELEQIGCAFKGFDSGLVDFPSTLDGRDIYLCWQLGEPSVEHWHELDAGFGGRQSIDPFHFPSSEP